MQLTLSAYLVGFAIGQIAYGPISDWYGRKSGLLVALACYCIGSLICFAAPSIDVLIGARVLQAFGGAGAIVLARAVVRDLYSGARAGKELSLMGLVMAFGPVSAPLIGGILHAFFGWRSSFAALLAFGIVVMVMVLRKMPETLGERPQERISLGAMLEGYRQILRSREFNIYLAIGAASYTGLIGMALGGALRPAEHLWPDAVKDFDRAVSECGRLSDRCADRLAHRVAHRNPAYRWRGRGPDDRLAP